LIRECPEEFLYKLATTNLAEIVLLVIFPTPFFTIFFESKFGQYMFSLKAVECKN